MSSTSKTVLERLRALPAFMQRQIESALLGPGDAPSGSTVDRVREVRLATLVQEAEEQLRAADPGTAPGSSGIRASTLPQDQRSQGGAMPRDPRSSSVAQGATAAASAAVAAAVQEERRRLLAEVHELPADLDQALAVAVDHARLARDAGADDAKVKTLLGTYTRMLWRRESVRAEFADIRELDALADFKMTGGARPRRKRRS